MMTVDEKMQTCVPRKASTLPSRLPALLQACNCNPPERKARFSFPESRISAYQSPALTLPGSTNL
jgi:hypothetical protein